MKREPMSNVGAVCEKHATKHNPMLVKDPQSLVGRWVKKVFPTGLKAPEAERMWVKIQRLEGDELIGRLDNDPLFIDELREGDTIRVKLSEVVEVTG